MHKFLYIFLFILYISSVNSYEDPTKFKDIDPKYISVEVNDPKQKVGYTVGDLIAVSYTHLTLPTTPYV